MVVVVMGAAGAGKSTVGVALAARLGFRFEDADRRHPPASVAKMARGEPLDEADRAPWLAGLAAEIDAWLAADEDVVLACSALRRAHRRALCRDSRRMRLVYLRAPRPLLEARLRGRSGHFAGLALLESQLATLEEPRGGIAVDASAPLADVVERIASAI